jgi:hypothetical protein
MDKSRLNQHNLNYWQLLRKNTRISTRTIDDLEEHIAFNSHDFLSDIKEYVLNSEITDADRYAEYLRIVVPRTRVLFDLVKKHLTGSLTLSEIVNYLEPFMVYHRDLTYRQYTDMVGFLRERIRDHKRNYALLKTQSDKVRTHNYGVIYLGMSVMYNLLVSGKAHEDGDGTGNPSAVFETYGFSKEQFNIGGDTAFQRADAADAEVRLRRALTPSELLHRMLVSDNARLYMCAVAKLNLELLASFDFGTLLNQQTHKFKQRKAEEEGKNKCANIVIAKQYLADSDDLERHLPGAIAGEGIHAFVFNFVDMLTHGRSESMILFEVARDEIALRAITKQWFERSSLFTLLKEASRRNISVVITSDHGALHCNSPATIFAKRDATANLRYKFGEDLRAERPEQALLFTNPDDLRLPHRGPGNNTLMAAGDTFFVYPTKLREYQSRYRGSFLHGGVSPEECILPVALLTPKR